MNRGRESKFEEWLCNGYYYISTWAGHGVPRLNIIPGGTCRVFLDEFSIWPGELSKADCPSQCVCGSIQSTEVLNRTQGRKRRNPCPTPSPHQFLPHCISWDISLLLPWIYTIFSPVLRPLNLDWIIPLVFLGLQFTDSTLWDFPAFIIVWVNSSY